MTTSSPDAARPLILIIDDESRIRRLVAANLETLGYDTAQAADGEIGFDIWKRLEPKPQLIVLDLMMPGMDGFAFLQKIREESEVPVILLTARSELSDKTKCLSAGADDYLVKPFAMDCGSIEKNFRQGLCGGRCAPRGRIRQRSAHPGPGKTRMPVGSRSYTAFRHGIPAPSGAREAPGRRHCA